MRANGSMGSGGGACVTPVDGSPNIVWGAEFLLLCESWSLHQHALLWGPPNDLAEGFSSWWLPRWNGANWTCSVGLLSSLAIMRLSACSEGADTWAINSTFSEGRRAVGVGPSVWGSCSEGYWFHW